jgi:pimeloyl-ACP methyl ester carboxylesterase
MEKLHLRKALQIQYARHSRESGNDEKARAARATGAAWKHGVLAVACITALALSGCYRYLAHRFEVPDHVTVPDFDSQIIQRQLGTSYRHFTTPTGVRVVFLLLDPGDYGFSYRWHANGTKLEFDFHSAAANSDPPVPKGTLIFIHGWGMDASSMLLWGLAFAQHGYRCVLVDLRGNGHSSSADVGYGTSESGDVAALIADLRARHRIAEPLILFGESYGADVALHASNKVPDVPGVVALEPFDNVAAALRSATSALAKGWQKTLLRPHTIERAIDQASADLHLDLRAMNAEAQVAKSPSCMLLIHGQQDKVVPIAHSRTLVRFSPRAQLLELPQDGHFSTPMRIDALAQPILDWIGRLQSGTITCPQISAARTPSVRDAAKARSPLQ